MNRCRLCVMPDTRPDTHFVDGICSACISHAKRKTIDWDARRQALLRILENTPRNGSGFDCIVPSSGGKDSHWQVLELIALGAKPLVVTATTCHETGIGKDNIENLARYASTLQYRPNRRVRKILNRAGLELVGDISWPEHVSIFTTPFRAALETGIPLIFYGENPQEAYGGPPGTDEALQMTRRWVSEFGGFLGLRPSDLVGYEIPDGIPTEPITPAGRKLQAVDLDEYMPPDPGAIARAGVRAYFLGQFLQWDSRKNANRAVDAGMQYWHYRPSEANWWVFENLDNAQTGLHDHMMFLKYGYGRACAQLSVDVRTGKLTRREALELVRRMDGAWPFPYLGYTEGEVLAGICTRDELQTWMLRFKNPAVVASTAERDYPADLV